MCLHLLGSEMRLLPTVSLVQCVSFFCGRTVQTNFTYVADRLVGMFAFLIGRMVWVPEGMRAPTPFMSRPNLFAALCSHVRLVATLVRRSSYSILMPVRGLMTLCMRSC